jgi:serine/threonine-protein kinase
MSATLESQPPKPPRSYGAGDVIARKYRLIRLLGAGGMGQVWEACNTHLDAPVAVKLIRAGVDGAAAAARLMREAKAAARLQHPAIVRVFDVGETSLSDPFVVMERLNGESLADLLTRERRLEATYALQILLPIADALVLAHSKGVVHRDVKPENIFLAQDESGKIQSKLLDFGVVRLDAGTERGHLTQSGTVVGSPSYLSPEQARGVSYDHRVDVWAFCVVLYELVAGEAPFGGDNYNALLRSIIEDEPKPTIDMAAGDRELWSIVERGLRKPVDERWPSMRALGGALAEWAYAQGVDEDVFGTGLEARWLAPGTGSGPSETASSANDSTLPPGARTGGRRRSRPSTRGATLASGNGLARRNARWVPAVAAGVLLIAAAGFAWFRARSSVSNPSVPSAQPTPKQSDPAAFLAEGERETKTGPSSPSPVAPPSIEPAELDTLRREPEPVPARAAPSAPRRTAPRSAKPGPAKKALRATSTKERATTDGLDLKAPY